MSFLVPLILFAASTLFSYILRPRVQRGTPERFGFPPITDGTVCPDIMGIGSVVPFVAWWGNVVTAPNHRLASATDYFAQAMMVVCHGPVDQLIDVRFGDKSIQGETPQRSQSLTQSLTAIADPALPLTRAGNPGGITTYLSAWAMYGGETQGGGIAGQLRLSWGTLTQGVDNLATLAFPTTSTQQASAYPGQCVAYFGCAPGSAGAVPAGELTNGRFLWSTNNPQPNPPTFVVQRIPNALGLGGVGDWNANPAEMLYDKLTSTSRGAGLSPSAIDTASFTAAGNVLNGTTAASDGTQQAFGLSCTLASQDPVEDTCQEILKHIDGVMYPDFATGLLTLKLLRGDYVIADLPVVTASNSDQFERTPNDWADTINQVRVKYRRFVNGGPSTPVVGEVPTFKLSVITTSISPPTGWVQWKTRQAPIAAVTVYIDGVDRTTLFEVDADTGIIMYIGLWSDVLGSHVITVDYTPNGFFIGFVDATAIHNNYANQTLTGTVRSGVYDYPFLTDEGDAQVVAARLAARLGVPVATAAWKQLRSLGVPAPGSCELVNRPDDGVTNVVYRIQDVRVNEVDNAWLDITAEEDIYQTSIVPQVPAGGTGGGTNALPTAPGIALGCVSPGSIRIGLFPSDTNFLIELARADDAGFTTAVTTLSSAIAGTTTFFDDSQTVGVTKYYRARLVRAGWNDGAWSAVLSCTGTAGTAGTPSGTDPTWTITTSETSTVGTATLTITDPQSRVSLVEYKSKAGTAAETSYTAFSAGPYTTTVAFSGTLDSTITFRATYQQASTGDTVTAEATATFAAPPPPALVPLIDGAGNLTAAWTLSGSAQSVKIAGSAAATPSDATTRAATAATAATGTTATLASGIATGGTGYVKAFAYSGAGGTGRESAAASVQTVAGSNVPADAEFLALALTAGLTAERVLNPLGGELVGTDHGANANYDLGLADAGTPGTYGDATHVPQITTDAKGRVTGVAAVAITGTPLGDHNHTSAAGDGGVLTNDEHDGFSEYVESTEPSSPAADKLRLYAVDVHGLTALDAKDATGFIHQVLRDIVLLAKNTTGSSIGVGAAVRVAGGATDGVAIALAKADADATMPAVGVTRAAIANNAYGWVAVLGAVAFMDTSAFTLGDLLYVSDVTAGALTTTRPTSRAQAIARVSGVSATVGNIEVLPAALLDLAALTGSGGGGAPTGAAGGDLAGTYPNPTIKSSVALGGNPTTTTQGANNNSTRVATTAYVDGAIAGIPGAGGGAVAQSYLGYNTAGGSFEAMTQRRVIAKQITLANAGLLASIGAYIKSDGASHVGGLTGVVFEDVAGTPGKVVGFVGVANANFLPETSAGVTAARWVDCPAGVWLAAGTYWIGVMDVSAVTLQIAFDTSGSDRTYVSGGSWYADWGFYTPTTSTKKYSIRGSLVR